jgi:hypothetical protein
MRPQDQHIWVEFNGPNGAIVFYPILSANHSCVVFVSLGIESSHYINKNYLFIYLLSARQLHAAHMCTSLFKLPKLRALSLTHPAKIWRMRRRQPPRYPEPKMFRWLR